jgi:hypothetical protein
VILQVLTQFARRGSLSGHPTRGRFGSAFHEVIVCSGATQSQVLGAPLNEPDERSVESAGPVAQMSCQIELPHASNTASAEKIKRPPTTANAKEHDR